MTQCYNLTIGFTKHQWQRYAASNGARYVACRYCLKLYNSAPDDDGIDTDHECGDGISECGLCIPAYAPTNV